MIRIQITSGRGPVECARVVHLVKEELIRDGEKSNIKIELINSEGDRKPGTFKSILLGISHSSTSKIKEFLSRWEGVIQWTGSSPYRYHHKRKNWFVGIEVFHLPEKEQIDLKLIRVETMRASGPGGQHINKTDSAVRIVHLPTGLCVTAREERSQTLNKELALSRLAARLKEKEENLNKNDEKTRWTSHNNLERGNPTRTFMRPLK